MGLYEKPKSMNVPQVSTFIFNFCMEWQGPRKTPDVHYNIQWPFKLAEIYVVEVINKIINANKMEIGYGFHSVLV